MNHLIIFTHPNPNSFGKGIADTVVKISEEMGSSIRLRDLYQMDFDPVLKPADFEAFKRGQVPEDIGAEQEHIRWADVITLIYPVWWGSMPARLKGYIDRVFANGFAYQYVNGEPQGLLKGKKALVFSTTGASSDLYAKSGMHDAMTKGVDQGIFNFCGIEEVKHIFFGEVPYVSDEMRKEYLEAVEKVIRASL